jgi:hypothetical protein
MEEVLKSVIQVYEEVFKDITWTQRKHITATLAILTV